MDAVALSVVSKHDCKSDFIPGEAYLSAVKKQLKSIDNYKDDRYQYKADGIIKMTNLGNLEVLLVETSGHYGNTDKTKANFDHHKGTFGALAMLKTIADEFNYAEIDVFANVKVFFVHAAETSIHLWSLSYKEEGIYELWREDSVEIKPSFAEHNDMLPDIIRFYHSMKKLIEETTENIVLLRNSHYSKKREFGYSELSPPLLTDVVNPTILALHQQQHSKGMSEEGPFFN